METALVPLASRARFVVSSASAREWYHLIEDEYGTTWVVAAHDPAKPLVSKLERRGFEYIVLPRRTFITGELEQAVAFEFVRSVRMADCLLVLETA